jgi:hypothetical protein
LPRQGRFFTFHFNPVEFVSRLHAHSPIMTPPSNGMTI